MSTLVLLVVLLGVVLAAWLWMKPNPRSPPILPGALPFIGHLHRLLGNRKHLWYFFRETQLYTQKQGGVCEVWFGPHSVYVITDPENSLTLSNAFIDKPYLYDFAKEFINNGLMTAEASIWKSHRRLLNPAFTQQVLNTYVNEMNVQARTLVSQVAPEAGKGPFDVRSYLINYVLSIVTRTLLDLSTEDQVLIDTDYAYGLHDLLVLFCDRGQKVWLHLSYIYKWSGLKRKENQLLHKLKDIMNPIILKRKSELKVTNVPDIYNEPTSTGKFKPVIDQMLQLAEERNAFTDDDIRDHLNTLLVGAYDTTSSAMTIILLVIGSYPNVQERIFNELQEIFEHDDTDITKLDLQKLVYLEAVIKESMRLYPVAPIIARKVDVEVNLSKLFSMMVMKVALAHIIRRYHVTGDIKNVVCEFDVLLKPVEGQNICLTLRT